MGMKTLPLGQGKFVFMNCAFGGQVSLSQLGDTSGFFGWWWVNGGLRMKVACPASWGSPGKLQAALSGNFTQQQNLL